MNKFFFGQNLPQQKKDDLRQLTSDVMIWNGLDVACLLLVELRSITRKKEGGYTVLYKKDKIETSIDIDQLGGKYQPSEDYFLLMKKDACSVFLKNENDIYLSKKNKEPEFLGVFQVLDHTQEGDVLTVIKDDEECLYDLETGRLIFAPIEGEKHWVNSTGCVTRQFHWNQTQERFTEVYTRNSNGLYKCTGRLFA